MKSTIFSALFFLAVSTQSYANSVCLTQASNMDLISEVARRLDFSSPNSQSVVVDLRCNSWQLQIELTTLDGNTGSDFINFSSSSACDSFIVKSGASKTLTSNKIVGTCTSYQLGRKLIKTDATFQDLPSINYRSSAECDAAAAKLIL